MAEHAWKRITIEAPLGLGGDFWECPVCGVGGGPAFGEEMTKRLLAEGRKERWQPIILGYGRRVSEDCETAQKQIRDFAEEIIARFREKWKSPHGEHSHYHSLFHDALRWNPQITNIRGLLDLMRDVESPSVMCDNKRPSLMDCRHKLEEMGYDMSGGALGAAIRELGEERLRQLRAGTDPDEES
jgi:hypothetical protein